MHINLRILFVIDSLGYGGAERQLVELVKALVKAGVYEVHIASLLQQGKGYYDIVDDLGVKIQYFPRRYRYDIIGPLIKIICYIRAHNIDLVHGFMNMGSLFGALAAKVTNRPVVCSAIRDAKDNSKKAQYLKQFLAKISDIYVANSYAGFANRFSAIKPHFRVVYNGIDFSRFEKAPDITSLEKEFNLSRFSNIIGMVGSFSNNKDQDTLLAAAPAIMKEFPDVGFLFVGDGVRHKFLESKVKSLGLDKHVIFTGFRADVDQLYRLMDICVLLTNSRIILEGMPNTVIEAMTCGVPVVASEGGGTSEIINHGETGMLVPPHSPIHTAEAIISILKDQSLKKDLVINAGDYVHEMFSLSRYVADYVNIYYGLMERV